MNPEEERPNRDIESEMTLGYTDSNPPPANKPASDQASATARGSQASKPPVQPQTDTATNFESISDMTSSPNIATMQQFGKYQVLEMLGQGAMGSVYLAMDTTLQRRVALKIPRFVGESRAEQRERFLREARLPASIMHPNICPVYEVGKLNNTPFLAMAYLEGETLQKHISSHAPMEEMEAVELTRKLASALAVAHQSKIVHRDLKPANIMINALGEPSIMDFGLAVATDQARMTSTGALMGTPAYMPLEQAIGDVSSIDGRSDVYSLGVILYEMLTGKLPFRGTLFEIIAKLQYEPPTKPSELRPEIDPELERIVLKAIAKKQSDRYETMKHFADALQEWRILRTTVAQFVPLASTTEMQRVAPSKSSSKGGLLVGGAGLLALLATTGFFFFQPPKPDPVPPTPPDKGGPIVDGSQPPVVVPKTSYTVTLTPAKALLELSEDVPGVTLYAKKGATYSLVIENPSADKKVVLVAELDGYESQRVELKPKAAGEERLEIVLLPKPAVVTIELFPSDLKLIAEDGAVINGKTITFPRPTGEKKWTIQGVADGYEAMTLDLTPKPGETFVRSLRLTPKPAVLTLNLAQPEAKVYLDNVLNMEKGPSRKLTETQPDSSRERMVRVELDGYKSWEKTIAFKPAGNETMNVSLDPKPATYYISTVPSGAKVTAVGVKLEQENDEWKFVVDNPAKPVEVTFTATAPNRRKLTQQFTAAIGKTSRITLTLLEFDREVDLKISEQFEKVRDACMANFEHYITTTFKSDDFELWRQSADDGNKHGIFLHAVYLDLIAQEPEKAYALFSHADELGLPYAKVTIAIRLTKGRGVPKNHEEGMSMLRKLANDGEPKAMVVLADELLNGAGKTQAKADEARSWLTKASFTKYCCGTTSLAELMLDQNQTTQALDLLQEAAKQFDVTATYDLGFVYLEGWGDIKKNPTKAVGYLKLAAEAGLPKAIGRYGYCFLKGEGVSRDPKKGIELLQKAMEKNDDFASLLLGRCYIYGDGVDKDPETGIRIVRNAAARNYVDAKMELGNCYTNGNGVNKDFKEAARIFKEVADSQRLAASPGYTPVGFTALGSHAFCLLSGDKSGHVQGFTLLKTAIDSGKIADGPLYSALGDCYLNGIGTDANRSLAAQNYKIAASKGDARAKEILKRLGM